MTTTPDGAKVIQQRLREYTSKTRTQRSTMDDDSMRVVYEHANGDLVPAFTDEEVTRMVKTVEGLVATPIVPMGYPEDEPIQPLQVLLWAAESWLDVQNELDMSKPKS